MVHLLRYITDNKTSGLKYYVDMKDAPLSDKMRKTSIKIDNQLIALSYYSWQHFYTLAELQYHILSFIRVGQFTMAHMFQEKFLNQAQK